MPARKLNPISESQFNSWRALVSCMHADGHVAEKEMKWLEQCLGRVDLSENQKQTLIYEFSNPVPLDDILPLITEAKDFAHLVHMSKILFCIDDKLDKHEKAIFQKIRNYHQEKFQVNMKAALIQNKVPSKRNPNAHRQLIEEWKAATGGRRSLATYFLWTRGIWIFFQDIFYLSAISLAYFGVPKEFAMIGLSVYPWIKKGLSL